MPAQVDNTNSDLLSVTAFLSVLLHAMIILGISFKLPDIAARANTDNNLEVVLVNNSNDKKVEDAELISSADSAGGGNDERDGSSPLPWEATQPSQIQSVKKTAKRVTQTQISPDQIITALNGDIAIQKKAPTPTEFRVDGSQSGRDKLTTETRQQEKERLLAKFNREWENYQKRPNRTFVGPVTKGHGAAKYLDAWKKRVVQVGNADFPVQIKARGLHGTLIVSLEINRNGTIHSIKVIQPSKHKVINDAALSIIRTASPFAAFPDEEFFEKTDILVITRAIHFLPNNRFDSTVENNRG